jgi:hypothetical protein
MEKAAMDGLIFVIGKLGVNLLTFCENNNDFISESMIALIILIYCSYTIGSFFNKDGATNNHFTLGTAVQRYNEKKLTVDDISFVSAHETGHIIIYSLLYNSLGYLPKNIESKINNNISEEGITGYVTGVLNNNSSKEKDTTYWFMLLHLAGQESEIFIKKTPTLGSAGDLTKWEWLAKQYLANQHYGLYFNSPDTAEEVEHNRQAYESLQKEQKKEIQLLLLSNSEIVYAIYNELKSAMFLDNNSIERHIKGVNIGNIGHLPFKHQSI